MTEPIVFYDIARQEAEGQIRAWNTNTWKTRYLLQMLLFCVGYSHKLGRYTLNYKGLPYKTEWVEFPDIEAVCIKYGAAPTSYTETGRPYYTLPMIYDPSTRKVVCDSHLINEYLDQTYPYTPAVLPKSTVALQVAFMDEVWDSTGGPLFNNILVPIAKGLNYRSAEYFRSTREKKYGKRLEDVAEEANWKAMEAGLAKVGQWLDANGPGQSSLVLGDTASAADFLLASILIWAKAILGEESPDWQRITSWHNGRWKKYLEQFDKYAAIH